jgi:transglutaminase-like putative cysteine protease
MLRRMFQAPQIPLNVQLKSYSNGLRGVAQTIGVMRRLVNEGKIDPIIRSAATSIVYLTPEKDAGAETMALFDHVQNRIRYVGDIHDVETISTAAKTLLGKIGDCDDKSVLLASLMEAIGYPTRFVVTGYGEPGHLEHVYMQVCIDDEWIDCDPTEPQPMGWAAPDPTTIYFERV